MESKRLTHIDLLKGIAIFFVILYHSELYSYNFLSEANFANYLLYYFQTILSACVPLFFFANGYLLFGKDFDLRKHVIKSIKLVLITVMWGILTLLLLQGIKGTYFSLIELVKALWHWKNGWINHLWYMGALICIYVFFPLLKNVYDTNLKVFYYFTIISAIFTFGNAFINYFGTLFVYLFWEEPIVLIDINFFNIFNPYRGIRGYSFVYFCFGGIAHHFQSAIEKIHVKKRNVISVIGILISCFGLFVTGFVYSKALGSIWDVVWNGYDSIFTFLNVFFLYLLSLNWKKDRRFVRLISSNTLGIYYTHRIILSFIRPHLLKYEFMMNLPFNIIYAFFILLVCLMACCFLRKIPVVSKLVNKP